MTPLPSIPLSLGELNFILGMISVVLLLFSEVLSSRYRTVMIRLNKDRLRKVALFSTLVFFVTLVMNTTAPYWMPVPAS